MKLIPKHVLEKIEKRITTIFLSASIFISILLVEAVILALTNQFKTTFVYFSLVPAFVITMLFPTLLNTDVKLLPKITVPLLLLILLVSLIMIFYPHDTFGGRDEAAYANLAVHLTKTSSLNIPTYLDNLPGRSAENYRVTPSGYTIWLGVTRSFLGDQGLLRGNLIIIILGLCSFFLVSSYLGGNKVGLIATTLFSSSMPFLWFSRETMSENLSFFLLWSLLLFLFIFLRSKRFIYLSIAFLCSWLFSLTRIEGFFIQLLLCLIIPIVLYVYKCGNLKRIFIVMFIYFVFVISNIVIVKNSYLPFLKTTVSAVKYTTIKNFKPILAEAKALNFKTITNINNVSNKADNNKLGDKFILFYFLMLVKYNFLIIIFSIFLVIPVFIFFQHNQIESSRLYFFAILAIILPELIKIISLNVTLDQPFMYRRYLYALLPFGYLCFSFFINQLKNKRLIIIIISIFLVTNAFLSKDIIFHKNNWSLIDTMEKITKNISKNDLVIIRVSNRQPIEYYYLNSYLIFNKGIRMINSYQFEEVHFDPKNKLFNNIPYEKIYLLSIENQERFPSFAVINRGEFKADYLQLVPSCKLYLLGEEEGLTNQYNIEILPFSTAAKYCSKPGNEIVHRKETLYLYELVYNKI